LASDHMLAQCHHDTWTATKTTADEGP
jgi:hypothetical protein